jgi:hypothetical protein
MLRSVGLLFLVVGGGDLGGGVLGSFAVLVRRRAFWICFTFSLPVVCLSPFLFPGPTSFSFG